MQYTASTLILSLSAAVSLIVAALAARRRGATGSVVFLLLMLAIAAYGAFAAVESASVRLADKIFWSTLEYVASGSVITLFLIFTLHFTRSRRLRPRTMALLAVLPLFNIALVATNAWHGLVWTDFLPGPAGSNQVIYEHGAAFFWIMACVYIYTLVSAWLLARATFARSMIYYRQSGVLLAGSLIPLVGGSTYMLDLSPPGLNITPMSFAVTGVIYGFGLFRYRMFDIVPVARDRLIEHMTDGVIVLDNHDRIVDINPVAQQLLASARQCIGAPASEVLSIWSEVPPWDSDHSSTEMVLRSAYLRFVELRITPLTGRNKRQLGRLIVVRDVTQTHEADVALRLANERLSRQLLEIDSLHAQLREQALRDPLTNLFNRRYLDETLPREWARAIRGRYPIALISFDIDHFKKVNDTFGHAMGDQLLRAFAEVLRRHSRSGDIAARLGGEEFSLIMPGMDVDEAYRRAEQIRRSFEAVAGTLQKEGLRTTVSCGVGAFPGDGETIEGLFGAVDKALYAAKANGRNRTQRVNSPPEDSAGEVLSWPSVLINAPRPSRLHLMSAERRPVLSMTAGGFGRNGLRN